MSKVVEISYNNLSNSIYLALTVLEVDSCLFDLVMKGKVEEAENYALSNPIETLFLPRKALFSSKKVITPKHDSNFEEFVEMIRRFAQVMKEAKS